MGWSFKIARIAGTELRVHVTFLLFLAWIGFIYYRQGGPNAAADGVLYVTLLFMCVVLHELGHVFAAKRFGISTPDITLLPIGGVARLQRMPDKPLQEFIVALAGPAVNLVIAGVILLATGAGDLLGAIQRSVQPGADLATRLMTVNVFLLLFNMIPAFPMDGGRVLRALIATRLPYGQATKIAARIGQGFALLFGFVGLLGNPILVLIALFIFIAASQEAAVASLKDLSSWMSVSDAMMTKISILSTHASVGDAAETLVRTSQHEFPVVDESGRVYGILTRDDIIKALRNGGPGVPAVDVMRREIPLVRQNASFEDAFRLMQESQCPALPVVDAWGRLVGMITLENAGEMMMIHSLPKQPPLPRAIAS
jgi:Zn-dependent protease/predicted transcriptional regulator